MKFRTGLLIGGALGYYYGSKAGHERFEQIDAVLARVRRLPAYQSARDQLLGTVAVAGEVAKSKAGDMVARVLPNEPEATFEPGLEFNPDFTPDPRGDPRRPPRRGPLRLTAVPGPPAGRCHTPWHTRAMGFRGKVAEQERARELRAQAWTLQEIATELGVSRSSVSLWVRDVAFEPKPREWSSSTARFRGANALQQRKAAEIAELLEEGRRRIGAMSEQEFLVAGAALYAGEGAKTDGVVKFANSDPRMIAFFCAWLRHFFEVDESRLAARALPPRGSRPRRGQRASGSSVTGIPRAQFIKPYRAVPDPSHPPDRSIRWGVRRSGTRARVPTGPCDGPGARAARVTDSSFRGSSAGRAPAC